MKNAGGLVHSRGADQKIGEILIKLKQVPIKDVALALIAQQEMQTIAAKDPSYRVLKLGELLLYAEKIKLASLHEALRLQKEKYASLRTEKPIAQKPKPTTWVGRVLSVFHKRNEKR